MGYLANKIKVALLLCVTGVLVVFGVLNLRDRLRPNPVPDDGIYWVDTKDGVQAGEIEPHSPLRFSIKEGDYLWGIRYNGKYEQIRYAETVERYLEGIGIGGDAMYVIDHRDDTLQGIYRSTQSLYDVEFKVLAAPLDKTKDLYLGLVGLVYLAIGLFVLLRQSRATLTYHFYAWFLASFVVYFYSSTQEFTRTDKLVHFLDVSAMALLSPLFLHFCAKFPSPKRPLPRLPLWQAALYVPAAVLVGLEVLDHYFPAIFQAGSLFQTREILDVVELSQLVGFFAAGSVLLIRSFIKAHTPTLRQQLKWIIWGLGLSLVPLAIFFFIPYLLHLNVPQWMNVLAYGPLILMPLSFGYSIVRYRLMDVDVIMRRSFVHVAAIVAMAALYMAVLLGVSDLVKFIWPTADQNSMKTKVIIVVGMLIVAMLFSPIKNKLQVWADRWFYGQRYTLRMGLQDFGRTLAQTTALPQLLDSLTRRLAEMLSVSKVGIFVQDWSTASGFRLAHSIGFDREVALPDQIRDILRTRSLGRGFISTPDIAATNGNGLETGELSSSFASGAWQEASAYAGNGSRDLYYYFPCVVRDRMVAIIGVGRADSGAFLTSEDTDLLRALSGYVAVAIDNSLLYLSEMEKAEELARLKDFSENIVESVSVGILVVDRNGYITTWNSALEEMFGISRSRALGQHVWRVLDPDLIETIRNATGQDDWALVDSRHIYKFHAATEDGRNLTVNVSVAPFEATGGDVVGTLVVIENVTERAQLEQQLVQREKLSSIGLLAAGVAHEVNTPLAGISSYSQMLLQQIPETDPKHNLLTKIHSQTLRASGIVNNLLNFSRTGDAQFQEVDLNHVLEDTLQLLEPQLRNTNIEIVHNYGIDLAPAYGNGSKLQQVFMNLILNARDAMPAGGRLSIQTRQIETSLVVEFSDSGVGIAPENIARIYDPFFTTKEVGQGTGLGLALSYGIIQEHGGRIFVESRPGEGARFTIKLPSAMSRHMQAASD